MHEYDIPLLERFTAHIEKMIRQEAWQAQDRATELGFLVAVADKHIDLSPTTISLDSGDAELDELFNYILSPEYATVTIIGSKNIEIINPIWEHICRDGLGRAEYEEIATAARDLILKRFINDDPSGEIAIIYLENQVLGEEQNLSAKQSWVSLLDKYAHTERLIRDPVYRSHFERKVKKNVGALKRNLPYGFKAERLYETVEKLMENEIQKADNKYEDSFIRAQLVQTLYMIGTPEALEMLEGRVQDTNEKKNVQEKAAQLLDMHQKYFAESQ